MYMIYVFVYLFVFTNVQPGIEMCTEGSNEARVCDTDEMTPVIVTATYKLFVLLFCVL